MALGSNRAFVRMSPRNPHKQWKKVTKRFEKLFGTIVKKVERQGLKFMRQNVPVASGRLRDSFRSRHTIDSKLRAVVFIESSVPYLRFIDEGTSPSVGGYVPILDRRIRTGVHPGIRGVGFMKKTMGQMQSVTNTELRSFHKKINREVGKHFPRGKRGSRVK